MRRRKSLGGLPDDRPALPPEWAAGDAAGSSEAERADLGVTVAADEEAGPLSALSEAELAALFSDGTNLDELEELEAAHMCEHALSPRGKQAASPRSRPHSAPHRRLAYSPNVPTSEQTSAANPDSAGRHEPSAPPAASPRRSSGGGTILLDDITILRLGATSGNPRDWSS